MKASINTLGHVLFAPSQYVIPVFQRNYRWERPQWEKLWASVIEIQGPGKSGNHFMGFLVFVQDGVSPPGQHSRFHLIDGQQRLTTTSLLLSAIRNVARRCENKDLADEIHDDYLVHHRKKGDQHFRILPKTKDHSNYKAVVLGEPLASGRITEALSYFEGRVEEHVSEDPDALRTLFNTVCQRLEFMYATLEDENAYSIFKSLNSTGVPLSQADLIRNFVFMHVSPNDHDEFERELWGNIENIFSGENDRLDEEAFSKFFRDWMMADGEYIPPKETFSTFESRFEGSGFEPKQLAQALIEDARIYQIIMGSNDDASDDVTHALRNLNALDPSTTYPLLLSLFRYRNIGKVTNEQLAHSIDMLSGFLMRRFVANESSRGYGRMFVRSFSNDDDDITLALQNYLLERGWPDDEKFVSDISNYPIYRSSYARHILERLERASGHKETANLGLAQIEHVMPQTITTHWRETLGDHHDSVHTEWLHRLGNLTLSAYNQEVGNQPFEVKRDRFKESNIGMTRSIAERNNWTLDDIKDRGISLAHIARQLWIGPAQPYTPAVVEKVDIDAKKDRLEFWTGLESILKRNYPSVPNIAPGTKRTIRLPRQVENIAVECRYKVTENSVHLDVYFMKSAQAILQMIKKDPHSLSQLLDGEWKIDQAPSGRYGWLTISLDAPNEGRLHWPTLQNWLARKLGAVYESFLPYLETELQAHSWKQGIVAANGFSRTKQLQLKYWHALGDYIRNSGLELTPQKPLPQNWTNFSIGKTGFSLMATVNTNENRLSVIINIESATPKEHFQSLLAQKEGIEADFGDPLDWRELPDKYSSRIALVRDESDLRDEARWTEYVQWMSDVLFRFQKAFRSRIEQL